MQLQVKILQRWNVYVRVSNWQNEDAKKLKTEPATIFQVDEWINKIYWHNQNSGEMLSDENHRRGGERGGGGSKFAIVGGVTDELCHVTIQLGSIAWLQSEKLIFGPH